MLPAVRAMNSRIIHFKRWRIRVYIEQDDRGKNTSHECSSPPTSGTSIRDRQWLALMTMRLAVDGEYNIGTETKHAVQWFRSEALQPNRGGDCPGRIRSRPRSHYDANPCCQHLRHI